MTKLGIKSNIMAVLMCIVGLVSGYTGALLLAGYILLFENIDSLRKTAIKVLTIMCMCSLLSELCGFIPDVISWISSILMLFGGSLYIGFLSSLCSILSGAVWLVETFMLVIMAINAYKGKDFSAGKLDKVVEAINEGIDVDTAFPKKVAQPAQESQRADSFGGFEDNGFGGSGFEDNGFGANVFGSDSEDKVNEGDQIDVFG